MDAHRPVDQVPHETDGLSRREVVLRVGAGGLAAALLAAVPSLVKAQETPAPEGGLPLGVSISPVSTIPVNDMPPGNVNVTIYRVTLEPGAVIPDSTFPFPSVFYTESGTIMCPGGEPRFIVRADGTTEQVGAEDVPVNTGESFYVPANVLDGGRNDGTEPVTVLVVDFVPAEGMATPTA